MLKSLLIKNFRLFREVRIETLTRVNLFTGENNSGKTVLLEALHLLFCEKGNLRDLPSVLRSGQGYPDDFDAFWMWLFYRRDPANLIEITASDVDALTYSVKSFAAPGDASLPTPSSDVPDYIDLVYLGNSHQISVRLMRSGGFGGSIFSDWPRSTVFTLRPSVPEEDANQFNRVAAKKGGRIRLVELLRVIEPRLQDLQYLKLGKQPLVYADIGLEDLVPITQLGQAFTRLLTLFSETLYAHSRFILIDEIESGIHYSVMNQVWKGLAEIAREEDLQIFATTHSYDCIRSAHEAFSGHESDLTLHRLERVGDKARVLSYDNVSLETSIDMNLEVR